MVLRLNEDTSSGLVSEFTFTSLKRPPYSRSSFSRSGPSALHGPHHGAQKSTSTGTSIEASMTSRSKEERVASIMGARVSHRYDATPHAKFTLTPHVAAQGKRRG